MKKLSMLSMLAASLMLSRMYAVEDAAGADAAPIAPDAALTPEQAAAEPVTVEVPAAHSSLIERAVALLKEAESDIVDNVEAGIAYLEKLWADRKAS